jgi:hypothetical protein
MKNMFDNLPTSDYYFDNKKYIVRDIFDIHLRFDKVKKYYTKNQYYVVHEVQEGEKWETIASYYYGNNNQKMFWIFMIMNNVEDPFFDFALTTSELGKATHYTEDINQITYDLYVAAINSNDEKRYIKILKKEYVTDFEKSFFGEVN